MLRETKQEVDPVLAAELELLAQEAEARWSDSFLIEPRAFIAYLSARLDPGAETAARFRSHAADLYLACGCMLQLSEAVKIFEATLGVEVAAALRHMHLQPSAIDDLCPMTREKLFVGGARCAPWISEYVRRGTLRGWTRVVITRTALNMLRDQKREVPLEQALLDQPVTDTCDPEVSCLRDRFGVMLERALEGAMRLLTVDERLLLRQRFVDGLASEQLAQIHRKHRITMIRRINGILRALRARTEALLVSEVGCGHSTSVSIVNLALSQAHLSIGRYLVARD